MIGAQSVKSAVLEVQSCPSFRSLKPERITGIEMSQGQHMMLCHGVEANVAVSHLLIIRNPLTNNDRHPGGELLLPGAHKHQDHRSTENEMFVLTSGMNWLVLTLEESRSVHGYVTKITVVPFV